MSSAHLVSGTAEQVRALLQDWESEADPAPLVVATSGSTGQRKRVLLSRGAMRASAKASLDRLGGPGQWCLTLPPTYVAGVQVLYRSLRAGTEPVLVQPGEGLSDALWRMSGPRRYVSLVPTQLVRALDNGRETGALMRCDAVLVGGGPLAPSVRAEAEAAHVRIVQTYGMSETCGGCVYDGLPLDDVDVETDDHGRIRICGPVLFDGYDGDPDATGAAFDGNWFRTDDLGRIDADGRLHVLGRADDVAISGGVKVPCLAVAAMVQTHPSITDAVVVGVPDPEWGERIVAVAVTYGEVSLEEVRDLVSPRVWAPRAMVPVRAIPLLDNGKVDRQTVQRLAAGA